MQTLSYKGYVGTAELDLGRNVCFGKVMFVRDLVTYEAHEISQIQAAFEAAVEDYLETCAELDREPERPFSGTLQVRISSSLHRRVAKCAALQNMTLNAAINDALDKFVTASAGS